MTIRHFKNISPTVAHNAYVDDAAVVIGNVVIGEDSSIWPMCSVRGDVNSIHIGNRTNIQDGSILHGTHDHESISGGWPVTIGDDVTVGHQCVIHGCAIESRCLIGMDTSILDGAIIRAGAFIGAGSLITEGKEIHGGYLWMGRPAKKVRELTEKERMWFIYSAQHYVSLKNHYLGKA